MWSYIIFVNILFGWQHNFELSNAYSAAMQKKKYVANIFNQIIKSDKNIFRLWISFNGQLKSHLLGI